MGSDFGNPLRKFKLVFLGEQSGEDDSSFSELFILLLVYQRKSNLKKTRGSQCWEYLGHWFAAVKWKYPT